MKRSELKNIIRDIIRESNEEAAMTPEELRTKTNKEIDDYNRYKNIRSLSSYIRNRNDKSRT